MKRTILATFLVLNLSACSRNIDSYDNSATWDALNESQKTGNFQSSMRQRLTTLGFKCASSDTPETSCSLEVNADGCTNVEEISFNGQGVSGYSLNSRCAP